jgi:SAM-dependent methyltransferase
MGRSASRRFVPAIHEPHLSRAVRRARGVYYTPPEVVRQLVGLTLNLMRGRRASKAAAREPLRILDPACGAGAMLLEARAQCKRGANMQLYGVDTDPEAIAAASAALPGAALWCGDALFDDRLHCLAPFDAIVANPPYVNIRQLAQSQPAEYIAQLRRRFHTARANFDLYVPFIERALELLAQGGCCGLVIPNKWATLDYAHPLRELLIADTTIEHVVDLASQRVFAEASVYPHLVVFKKRRPARAHAMRYHAGGRETAVRQRVLCPAALAFAAPLNVESRVATRPLGELATISCGTPGYSAERMAAALVEVGQVSNLPGVGLSNLPILSWQAPSLPHCDFITSGNIDRYQIKLGHVRFLGRVYERPILPLDAPALTERQRRLFASRKIVVAGLSQRIEAAWDDRGLALGVQVFALSDCQIDPQYLLAILNSKLLSYLFRTCFAGKRLAGGYMAINKGQLAKLPIVVRSLRERTLVSGRVEYSSYEDDAAIDQWIYRLYCLTKAEIEAVEAHFADLGCRAA